MSPGRALLTAIALCLVAWYAIDVAGLVIGGASVRQALSAAAYVRSEPRSR